MKKYLLAITFFLLFTNVLAASISYMGGTRVKYYYSSQYQAEDYKVLLWLGEGDREYFEMIRIFKPGLSRKSGFAHYYAPIIDIYDRLTPDLLIHEVAHRCQVRKGDTLRQVQEHRGNFRECEKGIMVRYSLNMEGEE